MGRDRSHILLSKRQMWPFEAFCMRPIFGQDCRAKLQSSNRFPACWSILPCTCITGEDSPLTLMPFARHFRSPAFCSLHKKQRPMLRHAFTCSLRRVAVWRDSGLLHKRPAQRHPSQLLPSVSSCRQCKIAEAAHEKGPWKPATRTARPKALSSRHKQPALVPLRLEVWSPIMSLPLYQRIAHVSFVPMHSSPGGRRLLTVPGCLAIPRSSRQQCCPLSFNRSICLWYILERRKHVLGPGHNYVRRRSI